MQVQVYDVMSDDSDDDYYSISSIVIIIRIITIELLVFWLSLQEATEANYVATMKTVRQVKTVFIIFIAFISCWIPYVFVLLYDSSDSLPLSVHLYSSMLAHLHASLNFAIYSLNSRNSGENCRHLVAFCCRHVSRSNAAVTTAAGVYRSRDHPQRTHGRRLRFTRGVDDINRTLVTADVECYELQELQG